jgi:alpha-glucosidase
MYKRIITAFICLFSIASYAGAVSENIRLSSPNGDNVVTINGIGKHLSYGVRHHGVQILKQSTLSMTVDGIQWGVNDNPKKIIRDNNCSEVFFAVPRKFSQCMNDYNEVTIVYKDYNVQFRAYDEGVAYRFIGGKNTVGEIGSEEVNYVFDPSDTSYVLLTDKLQNWFEEQYSIRKIGDLPKDSISIMPVMTKVNGLDILIAQADLHDYSGMYLRASGSGFKGVFANYPLKEKLFDGTNKLYAVERDPYIVKCNLKRNYPWHVLGIYDKDIDILTSELIYLLSTKTNDDYSWIKPGKAIWDWWNDRNIYNVDFKAGINTDTYDYLVDFASENNISYVLIDEGWSSKDDLLDLNPDVDMAEICERARAKGVGIILWAKWINVDRQMKEFFAQLSRWNVKGVKIDFMDRNDAKMVDFYERVAKISSRYHMMVDFSWFLSK